MTRLIARFLRSAAVTVWSLTLLSPASAADPSLAEAWRLTTQMRPGEADVLFRPGATSGNREAALGRVVAQLQLPPFTDEKLERMRQQLRRLTEKDPNDETGIRALYLLGRLRQLYDPNQATGDPPEFLELTRKHGGHYLAQLATLKLVLHRLYASGPEARDAERLEDAEKRIAAVTTPALQRDYHLMLGDAYVFLGDRRPAALRHYRAAEAMGIPDAATRATVLVQIGELARLEKETGVAIAAYQKFLGEFRRDIRGFEVRKRLATLEGMP